MAHTVVAFGAGLKRWPACSLSFGFPCSGALGPHWPRAPSHSGASTLARRLPCVLTPACIDSRVRRLAPHWCSQPCRQSQGGHGPWGAQVRSPVLTTFPLLPLGLPLPSWVALRVQTPQPQLTMTDDGRTTNDDGRQTTDNDDGRMTDNDSGRTTDNERRTNDGRRRRLTDDGRQRMVDGR